MAVCILLTACINPNGMSQTVLQDSVLRRKQYVESLSFYLKNTNLPIIFVENSGEDLSENFNKEIKEGRLEILVFYGNEYNHNLGKGYGESLNIQYALANSAIIRYSQFIIKITGRLIVNNISTLLLDFKLFPKKDLVISYLCKGFLDSRIFIATPKFLRDSFLPQMKRLNDSKGYYFESLLLDCIKKNRWRPFLLSLPQLNGMSGTYGTIIVSPSFFSKEYWRKLKMNYQEYLNKW